MMNRDRRLPDWLRFRSRPAAVVTALVICLLLAPWVAEAQSNSAPVFTEGASATRAFNETLGNAAVATRSNIGIPVAATDSDASDTLTYTLEGVNAARFDIISTSGQLRTQVGEKYDYEAKSNYQVRVRVEDGSGGSDTITITVNVTDQDEPPLAPRVGLVGSNGTSLFVEFYPPGNRGRPAITNYDARYRANNEGEWIDVPRDSLGLSYYSDSRGRAEIPNLEQRTLYYAQVRATNAEGDGAWSGSGYQETGAITSPTTYVRYGATSYTAFEGGADARVAVVLSRAPSEPVSFPIWKNAHLGGATEADYTGIPEYVTFNAGQRWSWFTVTATDDSVDDDGESVRLAFRTLPEGFRLDNPSRTTIVLDDADGLRNVEVRFDTHTHHTIEVREHIWPFRITLSLNQTPQRNLEIPLVVTEQGGATQEDYAGIPASVTFGPNETKTDFVMYAIPDQQQEVGEGLRIDFGTLPPGVRSLGHETIEFIEFDGNPWWYETEQWTEFWDTWSQTEHDDTDQATNNNSPNEGPGITGLPRAGEVLTATTSQIDDADGQKNASYSYQWVRHDLGTGTDTDIPGTTGSTYTVRTEDRNHGIKIRASFTDDAGNDETLTSFAILVLPPVNTPATGEPSITGTVRVDEELTADTSAVSDDDGMTNVAFSYQWIRSDGAADTEIANATAPTYTVADDDVGWTIRVRVTFTDDADHEESLTSAATALVQPPAPDGPPDTPNRPNATAVFVGGVDLEWNDVFGAESYDVQLGRGGQWIDLPGGGVEVAFYGAGAIISGLDPEASLWFRVRAANGHGVSDWSEVLYTGSTSQFKLGRKARPDNEPASGAPVVHGTAQAGESLWGDASGIEDGNGLDRVQFQYQWTSNDGSADADIAGATNSGYTLVADDVGRTIKVKVAFTDRGGYSETRTSAATEAVAAAPQPDRPATGGPSISGTAEVGETLTADTTGITDADGLVNATYGYQWVANDGGADADISGATDASYTLVDDDEGKTIKVRVIVTDDAGNETTLTSAATEIVSFAVQQQASNTPATGEPTIGGTPQVGETLTADTSGIADADGLSNVSYGYQWVANDGTTDTDISGATDATYTLVADDEGSTIKVRVIVTDDAGNETTLTSAATEIVSFAVQQQASNTHATGEPTIGGTPQVGETLTADTSGIADADGLSNVSYGYQWVANDGGADADISGATDDTYTLVADDVGSTIKVKVSFKDDAGNETTLTSAATEAVAARPNTSATGVPTIRGTAQVGEVLTADTTGIADADGLSSVSYGYQWVANDGGADADISGATDASYRLVADDEGKAIQVKVSFKDDAGNEERLTSAATEAVASGGPTEPPGRPLKLKGVANADGTVTLSWEAPEDDRVTGYQILRKRTSRGEQTLLVHVNDTGSTATEYTDSEVTPDVLHAYRVKAINAAGVSQRSNVVRVTPVEPEQPSGNSAATGRPSIVGTVRVGEVLTADTSGIGDADGLDNVSYSYQWVVTDGGGYLDISGATGATYTLVAIDRGLYIQVRVSFTDDAENGETLTSAVTEAVAAAP